MSDSSDARPPAPETTSEKIAQATSFPAVAVHPTVNLPLHKSDNERARALVHLDEQFISDIAPMAPELASLHLKSEGSADHSVN